MSIVFAVEVCYRHSDRETGVGCSSCERPICPDCMTTTSVGMRCPECARQTTKVQTAATLRAEPTLTYALIGVNVLVALAALLDNVLGGGVSLGGGSVLHALGAVSGEGIAEGEYWRLVTSGFLHYGPLHLLLNMYALYILGGLLEPAIGKLRFALVYFVSLLAGSFGAVLLTPYGNTAGASGAVFGMMGAALIVMRSRGIDPMSTGLPLILGLNLVITFTFAGFISVGGHLGGLAGGFLAGIVLFSLHDRLRVSAIVSTLLAVGLGALAVLGAIAASAAV